MMNNEEEPDSLGANLTLAEWLVYWLESYVKPVSKISGYWHYADNCFKHIMPILGHIELRNVTTSDIQKFFNLKAMAGNLKTGGPLSAKSVKNMRVVFDVAMKQAVAEGRITENPVPLTAIKRVRSKRVEALTDNDQAILEEWLFSQSDNYSNAELMAMFTGERRGEVCALRWRNYNERQGTVHIEETVKRLPNHDALPSDPRTKLEFSSVKSDSSDRILSLPLFLQEIIKRQQTMFVEQFGRFPSDEDFIFFSANGTVLDPDNLSHFHQKMLVKLGLQHKKLHVLRHSFATRGIENGIDVSTMSGLLGHADVTTTTHFYVRPRDAAMDIAMMNVRPVSRPMKPNTTAKDNTLINSPTMKYYRASDKASH